MYIIQNRIVLVVVIVFSVLYSFGHAQTLPLSGNMRNICDESCVGRDVIMCEMTVGLLLMDYGAQGLPRCVNKKEILLHNNLMARKHDGIHYLELAATKASRIGISDVHMAFLLGGAYLSASREALAMGNLSLSEQMSKKAGEQYIYIYEHKSNSMDDDVMLASVGLMRAGGAVKAIAFLLQHDVRDVRRFYMLAELYYSIGDDYAAAKYYDEWAQMKFATKLYVYSYDLYARQIWSYIPTGDKQDGCASLPTSLYERLKELGKDTDYLKTLPTCNHQPFRMLSHVD